MQKRTGFIIAAIMLLAGLVPMLGAAEPTRAPLVEIEEITIEADQGPGGEFTPGSHEITVVLGNTGDESYLDTTTLYLDIDHYPNGSSFYNTSKEFTPIISAGNTVNLSFDAIDMPEGSFAVQVNGTIMGEEKSELVVVDFEEVVDLSIDSDFFQGEMEYPLGEELVPTCNVTYNGNIQDWKDEVIINLKIEYLEESPVMAVYDRNMTIMDNASSPQDPGYVFSVMFDQGWTPEMDGEYRAVFSVEYDTYNVSNNDHSVFFDVGSMPSIEGWVTTSLGTPVANVTVDLWSTYRISVTTTDINGYYFFEEVDPGFYEIEFTRIWSTSDAANTTVVAGETSVLNATVDKMAVGGLMGTVELPDGTPAVDAEVTVNVPGEAPSTVKTDPDGNYTFDMLPAGTVSIKASMDGYEDDMVASFDIVEQTWNELDLFLEEIPFTVTFDPPNGEPGLPVDATLSLVFSRKIDFSTVDDTSVYLVDLGRSQNVPLIYNEFDEFTVMLTAMNNLDYGTDYRITVTEQVEDINGNNFPDILYSNFTTEEQLEYVEVVSFFPGNDQSDVPIDLRIRAVFPVPMDATTIDESTFQLFISGGGGEPIDGTVVYYSGNYTVEFIPLTDLEHGGRYSVSLGSEILALDSSYIYNGTTWSFETIPLITTGSVVGFVLDENGDPFSPDQVTITIESQDGTVMGLDVDLNGKFEETGLDEGTWTLTVEVPDYETYTEDFAITAGDDTVVDSIQMEEKEEDGALDNVGLIVLVLLIIVIIVILLYVFLGRREKPLEVEEEEPRGRRPSPAFSRGGYREERTAFARPEYDELAEGEFMCPVCGEVVGPEDPDCPNCGAEFEEDLFECPECGAMVPGEAPECPDCGAKFEEELSEDEEEEDLYSEEEEDLDITEDYEVDEMDEEEAFPERI